MTNAFRVVTCLDCKKRKMYDTIWGKSKTCHFCKSTNITEHVTASFQRAKKLEKIPVSHGFELIHQVLENKKKVVELLQELIKSCEAQVYKAELEEDPKGLKEVVEAMYSVVITGVEKKLEVKEEPST